MNGCRLRISRHKIDAAFEGIPEAPAFFKMILFCCPPGIFNTLTSQPDVYYIAVIEGELAGGVGLCMEHCHG